MPVRMFANPVSISIPSYNSWFTYTAPLDESGASGVPSYANGIIIRVENTSASADYNVGARPVTSADDNFKVGIFRGAKQHLLTSIDANRQCSLFAENTYITLSLLGYFYGDDLVIYDSFTMNSFGATGWQTLASGCPSSAKAAIVKLMVTNTNFTEARPRGSTMADPASAKFANTGSVVIVPLDANKDLEVYVGNTIYVRAGVMGYLKQGTWYTDPENRNKAPTTTGSWQTQSISEMTTGGAPVFYVRNQSIYDYAYGLRKPGSSDTNTRNLPRYAHCTFAMVNTNAASPPQTELYIENTAIQMLLMGWFSGVPQSVSTLAAIGASISQIDLSWTRIPEDFSGVDVYAGDTESSMSLLIQKASGSTSHSHTGLSERIAKFYKVRGVNEYGNGEWSNVALGKTKSRLSIQDAQGGAGVKDASGNPISGADVFVKDQFSEQLISVLTTDASGKASLDIPDWPRAVSVDFEPGRSNAYTAIFTDNFTSLSSNWVKKTGSGTASVVSDAQASDGYALQASGFVWYEHNQNIPVDPLKLYRIRARVRQTQDPTSGGKGIYIGVSGIASDGTTYININGANDYSSQHYFAAAGDTLTVDGYTEFVGYFWYCGKPAGQKSPNRESPGYLYPNVAYIRPLFALNYQDGNGVARLDYIIIEEVSSSEATVQSKHHIIV